MFGTHRSENECAALESKLVEYLDGRAQPAERHAVERHLAACAPCRTRAEEFRTLWGALDDLPLIAPSPAFDASLRARISADPARRNFWAWMPSPRFAFAVAALVAMAVWVTSMPRGITTPTVAGLTSQATQITAEADFGMIRDLPVLENYDVLSKFDALTELPGPSSTSSPAVTRETR